MPKIDLVGEILKKDDADIIDFLRDLTQSIRHDYALAVRENNSNLLWTSAYKVTMLSEIVKAMDKRNKDKEFDV